MWIKLKPPQPPVKNKNPGHVDDANEQDKKGGTNKKFWNRE